jgi:hypothetical protein
MLNDGTTVRISPQTKMGMGSQRLILSQLQPGDEVLIRIADGAKVTSTETAKGDGASALPRTDFWGATIDASEIQILRRPQAP